MRAQIDHKSFTAQLLDHDVFSIKYRDNSVCTLDDLRASYDSYLQLCSGRPTKVLIEVGTSAYFDIEANDCIKEGKILPEAEAIVTNSLAIRIAIDYYKYSRRNKHQLRIFKTTDDALEWLDTI